MISLKLLVRRRFLWYLKITICTSVLLHEPTLSLPELNSRPHSKSLIILSVKATWTIRVVLRSANVAGLVFAINLGEMREQLRVCDLWREQRQEEVSSGGYAASIRAFFTW
jgi:hypothetical protein